MILDEAIKQCEEIADYDCYNDNQRKRAEDYRQLAEWLKELKAVYELLDESDDGEEIFIGWLREKMKGNVL